MSDAEHDVAPMSASKHSHYFKSVAHLEQIDVYRVCDLFGVCSTVAHAVKKLLVSGGRGPKGQRQDLQEAIDTLQRKLAMMHEDELLSSVDVITPQDPGDS